MSRGKVKLETLSTPQSSTSKRRPPADEVVLVTSGSEGEDTEQCAEKRRKEALFFTEPPREPPPPRDPPRRHSKSTSRSRWEISDESSSDEGPQSSWSRKKRTRQQSLSPEPKGLGRRSEPVQGGQQSNSQEVGENGNARQSRSSVPQKQRTPFRMEMRSPARSNQPVQNREDVGAPPEEQNGFFNQSPPVCLPEPSEPLPIPNPLRGRSRTPVQRCVAPIEPTVQRRSNEANGSIGAALPNGRPAQKTAHSMDPSPSRLKVLVKGLFPGHSRQQIRACFGETKIVGVGIGFAERGTTGEALVEFAVEEDALRAWGCRVRNIGLRQIDVMKYTGLGMCQSTIFIK
ncbi:hypothetical protein AAVH_33086, partial [Aphelenchoides avenae]